MQNADSADPGELVAESRAVDLAVEIYEVTNSWPRHEQFGMTSQIRRAVVSVGANIAEGKGRNGRREFLHHLSIAHGSLREVELLLKIATRLKYIDELTSNDLRAGCDSTGRPLRGLIRKLRGDLEGQQ